MTRKQLLKSLERMRTKLCSYTKPPCDCKFISDNDTDLSICGLHENGSGCPEIYTVMGLIQAMTEEEFIVIAKRAGLSSRFDEVPKKQTYHKHNKMQIDKSKFDEIIKNFTQSIFELIQNNQQEK